MGPSPTRKKGEWEKERRNRINVALDTLAKTLPHVDPTSTLSKIEIIHKAILVVQELQAKVKVLLAGNASTMLKTQEQLEDGFKVLLVRNNELVDLLQQHKIAIPPYTAPAILNCVVHKIPDGTSENNCNEMNVKTAKGASDKLNAIESNQNSMLENKEANVDTSKESNGNTALKPTNSETHAITASIVPIKIIKVPVLRPLIRFDSSNRRHLRFIRPAAAVPGKVGIPHLKRLVAKKYVKPLTVKQKQLSVGRKLSAANVIKNKKRPVVSTKEKVSGKMLSKVYSKEQIVKQDVQNATCSLSEKDSKVSNDIFEPFDSQLNDSGAKPVVHKSIPAEVTDLSSVILDSLNVPQHNTNRDSLSPTAAYLLAFPVVAGGKRIEDIESNEESCITPVIMQTESTKHDHNNILDNISSLLTTRDYDRFVEEEVNKPDIRKSNAEKTFRMDLKTMVATKINHLENSANKDCQKDFKTTLNDTSNCPETTKPTKNCSPTKKINEVHDFTSQKMDGMIGFEQPFPNCDLEKSAFTFSLTATTNTFVPSQSSESGFYDSLSNIGNPSTHRADSKISNHYSMAPLIPNLYLSTQTPPSTGFARNTDDNQTPFTFSLTSATQTLSTVSKSTPSTSSINKPIPPPTSTTFSISTLTSTMCPAQYNPSMSYTSTSNYSQPTSNLNSTHVTSSFNHNTYNPFAFDNITAKGENTNFTFSLSSTTNSTTSSSTRKHQPPNNPFSIDYNILSDQKPSKRSSLPFGICSAVTPVPTPQSIPADPDPIHFYSSKPPTYQPHFNQPNRIKPSPQKSIPIKTNHKSHVNWMTTPGDYNPTIPTTINQPPSSYHTPKPTEMNYALPAVAEDTFNWSPNKLMVDTSGNAALPNLHGDLALNNFIARPHLSSIPSTKRTKKTHPHTMPSCNSSFTVSQLVDQHKPTGEFSGIEMKSKTNPKDKRTTATSNTSSFNYSSNIFVDSFTNPRQLKTTVTSHSNNYSAEALLSSQCSAFPSAPYKQREKYQSNFLSTGDYFHPDAASIPAALDFDPFYGHSSYLPQKHICPEADYLGATTNDVGFAASKPSHRTDPLHQAPPPSHVYPFNTASATTRTPTHVTKPQKQQAANQTMDKKFNSFDSSSVNYYSPMVDTSSTSTLPHATRDAIVNPAVQNHHQSGDQFSYPYPHYHHGHHQLPIGSASAGSAAPSKLHQKYPGQMGVNTVPASVYHSVGTAHFGSTATTNSSYASTNPSHLVSDFNLSTICPEINDKIVQQQQANNW